MTRLDVVTKQMWNTLTATLLGWQNSRKAELDQARANLVAQGNMAQSAADAANTQRQQMLSAAAIAGLQQVDSPDKIGADGTYLSRSDMTVYTRSGGNLSAGLKLTTHADLDAGVKRAYSFAQSAALHCPRTAYKLRNGLPVTFLLIGSSSLDDYGVTDHSQSFQVQFQNAMQAMYPECQINVIKRAVGGRRIPDLEPELGDYINCNPDCIICAIGTNDGNSSSPPLAEFRQRYEAMIRILIGKTGCDFIGVTSQSWPGMTQTNTRYNRAILDACRAAGVGWYDRTYRMQLMVARGEYTALQLLWGDQFHGNATEYTAWAQDMALAFQFSVGADDRNATVSVPWTMATIVPAITAADNAGLSNPLYPAAMGFCGTVIPAGTSRTYSIAYFGTGIRWGVAEGSGWANVAKLEMIHDDEVTTLPIPRADGIGTNLRGGMWTLVEGKASGMHYLTLRVTAGSADVNGAYWSRFEVIYDPKMPGQPNESLALIHGAGTVISGCQVSANDNMTLTYGPGEILVLGSRVPSGPINQSPVTINNGDASNPRIDAVYLRQGTNLTVVQGTPTANPVAPVSGGVLLAHILVPAGATKGSQLKVLDKRALLSKGIHYLGTNGRMGTELITAYPDQALSTMGINSGMAAGWPTNNAGQVRTWRWGQDAAECHQTYTDTAGATWSREPTAGGAGWTAWTMQGGSSCKTVNVDVPAIAAGTKWSTGLDWPGAKTGDVVVINMRGQPVGTVVGGVVNDGSVVLALTNNTASALTAQTFAIHLALIKS